MTPPPVIDVRGLTKSFGDTAVLRGLNLTAAEGQVLALLGANGAGKTTAVRILATLLAADAGTASVAGYDVACEPERVREVISLTGQFAAVDEALTGRENLELVARLRRLPHAARTADDLLARFDLVDAARRPAKTYSGGMRRRLDLAMSLVGEPRVLVLDEPTTGLDPQSRQQVWRCVDELTSGGTTVLLTTQYLEEAERLADRVAILHGGRVLVEGSPAELKSLYPPATREYVEKQPTLEEVFLAIVGAGSNRTDVAGARAKEVAR